MQVSWVNFQNTLEKCLILIPFYIRRAGQIGTKENNVGTRNMIQERTGTLETKDHLKFRFLDIEAFTANY